MQKSELLSVFYLLIDRELVNKPIRTIAETAGVSVGSVHSVLTTLTEQGFIVEQGKTRKLRKRDALIDRWAYAYADSLKSKLFISRFSFLSAKVREEWREIVLPLSCAWGGEPASAMQDNYLEPGRWDVYVAENANALITTGRMIPCAQGEIYVYKRFWHTDETPLLVVYADLLGSGDDRNKEAAERIRLLL